MLKSIMKNIKNNIDNIELFIEIFIVIICTIMCLFLILYYSCYEINDREYSIEEIIGIYDCHSEEIYYDDQYNKLIEEKRLTISIIGGEYVGTVSVLRMGYGKYYDQSQSPRILYQEKVVLSEKGIQIGGHKGYIKTKTIEATEIENKKRIREITIEGVTYRAVIY